MSTFFPKGLDKFDRKWFVVDATGLPVGRLSTVVADVLSGKNKPTWTPFLDMGDHVVVINAAKVVLTGKKNTTKMYRRTTTQPGSMVEVRADVMRNTFPSRIIESAVKGMLPKGPLGRAMYRKLKVYDGAEHLQTSQQPEPMTIKL
jgi:large subunit ribosomal protein L13